MNLPKHLKIAAGAGGAALFGILFGWVMFPAILKMQLKKEMALTKKTDVRQMWQKIPFALDFKVYLFNYTNAEEVQKGAAPIVKEVGPYYFEEWKEKVEVEDHESNDTITYKKVDVFYFKPELSGPGLTGEEIIVLPHIFMVATATVVAREKPTMLNVVGKALNGIFDNPADIFMRVKVLDLLFRGIVINCDRSEFAPKAVCTALKKEEVAGLTLEANNQFRFSLFGTRNGTVDPHVVTVKRGKKNVMDVGQVIAIDGKPKLDIWTGQCNEYQGTDGTVFPPFLTEKDRLQSFAGDLCRSFKPWYQKKSSYRGIKTNRYVANIGDFANDPELNCFCEAPDQCPPKGLMDLFKCMKLMTALDFYASGSYQRRVGFSYNHGMCQTSVHKCISEVTAALNKPEVLSHHIKFPGSRQDRLEVSMGFMERFRFPGVVGCIDGTHVAIIRPRDDEEAFFNRKHYHSLNAMIAPMYASLPHFLDSDPTLLQNIKGLNPDTNEHGIEIDFEPISGTPMVAKQRVQFNMRLLKTEKLELFKDLPDTIVPLFWIEEGLALNKTFVNMLKFQLFIPKRAVGVVKWLLVTCGSLTAIGCLVYQYKDKIMQFAVSPGSAQSKSKVKPVETKDISIIGEGQDQVQVQEPAKISM